MPTELLLAARDSMDVNVFIDLMNNAVALKEMDSFVDQMIPAVVL